LFTAFAVGLCHFLSAQKVAQKGAPAASWSLLLQNHFLTSHAEHPVLTRRDRRRVDLTIPCSQELIARP
jgi:hypothetical protein